MVRGKQIRVSSVADTEGVESTASGLVIVLPCGFRRRDLVDCDTPAQDCITSP